MSKDMIILIKGEPDDINRTVTAGIVYEQWIYPSYEYLYFENNILSSWQN